MLDQRVKEPTEELQYSKDQYDELTARIPLGIYKLRIRVDGTMRYEYVNARFCEFCGASATAVLTDASAAWAHIHPDDLKSRITLNQEVARTLQPFQWEGRYIIAGQTRWFRLESAPTALSNGDSLWTGVMSDITERKQTDAALLEAKQAAEAANRSKSEFLANMSHEIRTPMNAILGLTQLVLDTELAPQQKDFLRKAYSSGKALLRILNDILDYSKVEAGHLDIEHVPLRVQDLLQNVVDLFAARIEEKGLEIIFDISPEVPTKVLSDPLRLAQVLNNLVDNAIKFTERGKIFLKVDAPSFGTNSLTLRFSIRDTGIGLSKEQSDRLFQAFTQADGSITRKYGGTGLGLTICQKLVNLMGGDIAVSGIDGQGTTFIFTVEVGAISTHPDSANLLPQLSSETELQRFDGARILLVEDNDINQIVANELLKSRGIVVTLANNGQEALDWVKQQTFDAVLMDLHMPVMDGFEATRSIRELPQGQPLPVIAMTAAVMGEDRENCTAIGMVDFIAKPIDPDKLTEVLLRWLPAYASATTVIEATQNEASLTNDLPGFDLASALRRLDGNRSLLVRLLLDFVEERRNVLAQLDAMIQFGSLIEAQRLLHTLKGTASNLGIVGLAQSANQWERDMATGDPLASRQAFAQALEAAFAAINTHIQPLSTPDTLATCDLPALTELFQALRAFLREGELVPDELMVSLNHLTHSDLPGAPLARLLKQIDKFDNNAALDTIAQVATDWGLEL